MNFRYLLYFEATACLDVLARLADIGESGFAASTTVVGADRAVTLPFGHKNTGAPLSCDDPSLDWEFTTVLAFEPDGVIESYEGDNHQRDERGRAIIGIIDLRVHRDTTGDPARGGEQLVAFEFGTTGSSMSLLFAESPSIRRTFVELLDSCRGVCGVFDMEVEVDLFWLRGREMTQSLPSAYLSVAEIEEVVGVEMPIEFSYRADELTAVARHERRMFGGAELGVNHWLLALLSIKVPLPGALDGLDTPPGAEDLRRRLSSGDTGEPLSEDDVRSLGTALARRKGRHLVRAGDLAQVIVDLIPSISGRAGEAPGVVEFYPQGLLHKFGFGDGDMLYDLIEEQHLGVDHQDLLIAVVEQLVVPRLDQAVETYTLVSLHNPIRAKTVDGEEADMDSMLTPEIIEIPMTDIVRIARTLPPVDPDGY